MGMHRLSAANIAFLYVGALMGAGFASGREIWQFFGVFGGKSYPAVLAITVFFIFFGMMTVKISQSMGTTDIGKIVMPFKNACLEGFFGYVTAAILFIVYIVMAAAGGALFQAQFGLPKAVGGIILMFMVIATILGGFERISKNFKYIIPVLLIMVFLVCFLIISLDLPVAGRAIELKASPMAPNWLIAAVIYISYNMLAGVPILANSAQRAKTYGTALAGAALGGLILGLSALILDLAMLTDAGLSSESVLPILALSGKLPEPLRWSYALLLLFAVYASATSNFYGFTTKIKAGRNKKTYLILAALAGFLLSLFGFAEIIAFVLPLEGYFGLLLLIAMTVHYFRIRALEKKGDQPVEREKEKKMEKEMKKGIDREKEQEKDQEKGKEQEQERFQYAGGIRRVTGGAGGEALLVTGSEKTALIDCGMAYCGAALAENIKRELGDRPLDYVMLSHTHYDHIGGLPYLRRVWPGLISCGAPYAKKVLEKDSALKQIEAMSEAAWRKFKGFAAGEKVLMDGMGVDRVVGENDVVSLGDKALRVFETPGHTSCSLAFLLEPDQILFAGETSGVYLEGGFANGMLKSCRETLESIEKCRNIQAEYIISPHYGQVPDRDSGRYWDLARASVEESRDFVLEKLKEGRSWEQIMEEYEKEFYTEGVDEEQPKEAFLLNAQHMIRNLIREFEESETIG